jgi:CheY-like chemotaxis protein
MTDMARHLIGEEIVISTKLVEDVWTTEGDGGQIEQVLMNLIVNARDAMPQGGRLAIATENVHVDRLYCETVRYARPGRFVCVSVSDTGVGMDRGMLQRIFEPFYTTKGAGHGTGLGLSVAYGIVKQHDGWINVYSEPGRGSTFRVYFPAVPARVLSSKAEKPCCLQGFRSSGEKILVVEDEEVVREFSTRTLQEHGYVTFSAASVQEALDIFEEEDGDFSLVLSDVVLPDQTGLDLIRLLRARNPGLAVLLTSGYSDSRSRWEEIRRQGFRFLQKPFNLVELLRTLRDVLENDRTA